jgi:hypothetical protein
VNKETIELSVNATQGFKFGERSSCRHPFLDDKTTDKCIFCELDLDNEKDYCFIDPEPPELS